MKVLFFLLLTCTALAQPGGAPFGFMKSGAVDPDAQTFIDSAGITNTTQKNAINSLVINLKNANLWTGMVAIYPMVGGTAETHKWNLKDPRNLNAAYRLVFTGGWTHSATGAKPNGVDASAETYLLGNSLSQNSTALNYYSRTDANEGRVDMGYFSSSALYLAYRFNSTIYPSIHAAESSGGASPYTTSLGLITGSRVNATQTVFYQDGAIKGTYARASVAPAAVTILLGAYKSGGSPTLFSTKECAFASIGAGLTDADVANLYTSVQAYQSALGR
jgi:hypothetical protein